MYITISLTRVMTFDAGDFPFLQSLENCYPCMPYGKISRDLIRSRVILSWFCVILSWSHICIIFHRLYHYILLHSILMDLKKRSNQINMDNITCSMVCKSLVFICYQPTVNLFSYPFCHLPLSYYFICFISIPLFILFQIIYLNVSNTHGLLVSHQLTIYYHSLWTSSHLYSTHCLKKIVLMILTERFFLKSRRSVAIGFNNRKGCTLSFDQLEWLMLVPFSYRLSNSNFQYKRRIFKFLYKKRASF